MNIIRPSIIFSIFLATSIVACSKPTEPPIAPTGESNGSSTPSSNETSTITGTQGLLTATYGGISCDSPADATISWNAAPKGTESVEVWVGEGDDAILFASGGAQGSQATGPWVKPSTLFVLRNQADKTEFDRVNIPGPVCP